MRKAALAPQLQRLVIGFRVAPQPSDGAPEWIGTPRLHGSGRWRSVIPVAAVIEVRGLAADISNFDRGRSGKLPLHRSAPLNVVRLDSIRRHSDHVQRRSGRLLTNGI